MQAGEVRDWWSSPSGETAAGQAAWPAASHFCALFKKAKRNRPSGSKFGGVDRTKRRVACESSSRLLWLKLLSKCVLALACLVLFVPYDWWYRYITGPQPITDFPPSIYTECAPDDARVRLALVMPMTAHELPRAVANMHSWAWDPRLAPCEEHPLGIATNSLADFYFYFDLPLDENDEIVEAVTMLERMVHEWPPSTRRCFGTIGFLSANMTPAESRNAYRHSLVTTQVSTRGTVTQFYRLMLENPLLENRYTHAFYMETDTRPVRAGWLEALRRHADPSVWMKGSIMRYPKPTVLGFEPYRSIYLYHINGNAIYRLGCPCFKAFLRAVMATYRDYAFDTSMAFYRLEMRRYALFQRIAHRFAFTDVVADWCDHAYSSSELGRTYLVHGKANITRFDWRKLGRY